MGQTLSRALVRTMLQHAEDFPFTMQEIGLMGLRLDDRREHRLHIWDPTNCDGEPPIHDHPYDFTSTIIAGELTNVRHVEDPAGDEYVRFHYSIGAEEARWSDSVHLSSEGTTFTAGDEYGQRAPDLHASWQEPGTVTAIRCDWVAPRALTVCVRDIDGWRSGQSRPATRYEIKSFAAKALEWF
jgi:hypothetical protein